MNIDLTRLIHSYIEEIKIDTTIHFNDEYLKTTELRGLSDIEVKGSIIETDDTLYDLDLTIKGEMILPCAITLEDVSYPFTVKVNEILSETDENDEKYIKIINNSIDIMPIIWQNIVMEIPLKVVSPNADKVRLEGNGWRLLTDEERNKELVDPRLDKLKDLLDD